MFQPAPSAPDRQRPPGVPRNLQENPVAAFRLRRFVPDGRVAGTVQRCRVRRLCNATGERQVSWHHIGRASDPR